MSKTETYGCKKQKGEDANWRLYGKVDGTLLNFAILRVNLDSGRSEGSPRTRCRLPHLE
jgi:hypothetical protein